MPAAPRRGPRYLRRRPSPSHTSTQTIESVWFRATPKLDEWSFGKPRRLLHVYQDQGRLTVSARSAEFIGKNGRVLIADIKRVSYSRPKVLLGDYRGLWGWARIDYGVDEIAMFFDSRWFGWAGILGRNRRILDAVSHLAPQS